MALRIFQCTKGPKDPAGTFAWDGRVHEETRRQGPHEMTLRKFLEF